MIISMSKTKSLQSSDFNMVLAIFVNYELFVIKKTFSLFLDDNFLFPQRGGVVVNLLCESPPIRRGYSSENDSFLRLVTPKFFNEKKTVKNNCEGMDKSALLNETEKNPFRKSTLNEKKSATSQSQSVKKSRPCKILALGLYNLTFQVRTAVQVLGYLL